MPLGSVHMGPGPWEEINTEFLNLIEQISKKILSMWIDLEMHLLLTGNNFQQILNKFLFASCFARAQTKITYLRKLCSKFLTSQQIKRLIPKFPLCTPFLNVSVRTHKLIHKCSFPFVNYLSNTCISI